MKQVFNLNFRDFFEKKSEKKENFLEIIEKVFESRHLEASVKTSIYIPRLKKSSQRNPFSLLLLNDGQDMEAVQLEATLKDLSFFNQIKPLVVVGIFPTNRMDEYGTAHTPDYANRGTKAEAYTQFILTELLPFLEKKYSISKTPEDRAFAGFSLGGLSAFDIVWNHPNTFGKVGIFSGSLWWRSKAFDPNDPDGNRIVHTMVAKDTIEKRSSLRFWLQTGTNDEKEDRNNNGVIDAIDDTLDLIKELEKLGFNRQQAIEYVEVEGGEHHPSTWAKVMPDFLKWAFNTV